MKEGLQRVRQHVSERTVLAIMPLLAAMRTEAISARVTAGDADPHQFVIGRWHLLVMVAGGLSFHALMASV